MATHVPIIIIVQYILTNRDEKKKLLLFSKCGFTFSIDNNEKKKRKLKMYINEKMKRSLMMEFGYLINCHDDRLLWPLT